MRLLSGHLASTSRRVGLTLVAIAWLLAARPSAQTPLRFVGDRDYPPLSYLDNGEPRGFDVDVAREIGRALGRPVQIDLMEWIDAQAAVQRGDADALTDLAISDERRRLYEFAESTLVHDFGLFVRENDTSISTLNAVRGKAVGVTAGGFPREFFERRPDVRVVIVDNYEDGFRRLQAGGIDALAADVWAGASTAERAGFLGVALSGEPFASLPAAVAVLRNNAALLADINRAIGMLRSDGTIARIEARWRPRQMVFLSRQRATRYVLLGIGTAIAALVIGLTLWVRALRKQIRERREFDRVLVEHNQRLALALAAADMGTWRWSADTDLDTRDGGLNAILGLTAVETTRPVDDFFARVHDDDRAATRAEFERAIRERNAYFAEFRIVRPDGTIRHLRGRGKAFYDDEGKVVYATGVAIDVTERRQVEEHAALLARAVQASGDLITITSPDRHILYANDAFLAAYGYEEREVIGQHIELIRADDRPNPVPDAELGTGAVETWRGEIWGRTKSGRLFPVSLSTAVLRGADGRVVGVVGAARDITDEKLAEDALRASEEKFFKAFESSPNAIIVHSVPAGVILMVNRVFEEITGYTRAALAGRSVHDVGLFVGSTYFARTTPLAEGGFRDIDFELRTRSGTFLSVLGSASSIEIERQPSAITALRDVTLQRRFERHQRQAAEVNRLILSNMDLERLCVAVVESAHQVLTLDYACLILCDPATGAISLKTCRGSLDMERTRPGAQAVAARTVQTKAIQWLEAEHLIALGADVRSLVDGGLQSVCGLPLLTPQATLGAIVVGSLRPHAFTAEDATLLQQLAAYVAIAIQNARSYEEITSLKDRLSQEKLYLEEEIRVDQNFSDIIGESQAIRRVLQQIQTVAATNASVLILGETGTGKELLARALHDLSPRRERTFVRMNVASLPATLIESELFGHERGAFTGAVNAKVGRMELAHRGTLFLDEVGDIPAEIQPKLLRVLQEREFERLGSTKTITVDVRIVAATNRDLQQMVDDGTFRRDLFYRLNVFPVEVPPLRDRREDIPALVRYFVQTFATRMKRKITSIPTSAMAALQDWEWPGNIRELENVIERAVIISPGDVLQVPPFQMKLDGEALVAAALAGPAELSAFHAAERDVILEALRETHGVIAGPEGAAARLGMKRTTLQSKMRKLGIRRPSF